jgi:transposase
MTGGCAAGGTWTWAGRGLWLQAEVRRLQCRRCWRARTEQVPWARPRARHSRDFQDVVAWLAQRTDRLHAFRLLDDQPVPDSY